MKEERKKIQDTLDGTMSKGKGSESGKQRESLKALRDKKAALINEKKAIRAQLDSLKVAGDKLVKDRNDQRSSVKFSSPEEIDKEIAKMQRRQETTSMSLTEEKKLLKEMEVLRASKDKIKDLKSTETDMEGIKLKRKAISDSIAAKDKEIDAVQKEIDAGQQKVKEMSDKDTEKRSALDELFKKRDELKKAMADKLKEKDAMRDEFREKNNAWYNTQRAVKAQKQLQYEEEKKKRDEEKTAYLAKLEEEEAKKIPYEEEQALCDYLADYLERTYITGEDEGVGPKVAAKKEDVIAVKEDPFANFKPVSKKDEDAEYFGKGKGKKKRQRAPKKPETAGPFTLNVDSFEQFGLIGLNPPTSRAEVEGSIKELRERKEWYKTQPRGSVPTAKDIRKQNEKAAAKLRQDGGAPAVSTPSRAGKFDLSNTEEFVPLGKGASTAVDASSWGQKPASPATEPEAEAAEAS